MRLIQVLIDLLIVGASFAAAYLARFDGHIPESFLTQLVYLLPLVVALRAGTNVAFGLYRVVWRYVGIREALLFARAVASVSFLLLALRLFLPSSGTVFKVPISVIFLEGTFTFLGLCASRLLRRVAHERSVRITGGKKDQGTPTLLVGAGQNGLAIAKEALKHPLLGIRPLGFLDDDDTKAGMELHGLRVLGALADA